jgi:hypothetical protein
VADAKPPAPGFSWNRAATGTALGGVVALIAHYTEASPWWWLALPAGFLLGFVSFQLSFSMSWGKRGDGNPRR